MLKIFPSLLAVLFIGLKLTNTIDWSWWWVLSPLFITVAVCGVLLSMVFVLAFVGAIAGDR